MVDLSTKIGSLTLKNPVTNCAGTFESGRPYEDFVNVGDLGAVTTKGMSLEPWEGNETPRLAEIEAGMINCIGLQNDGIEKWLEVDFPWLKERNATIIANVVGKTETEYVEIVERLNEVDIDAFEINISCPNVDCRGAAIAVDALKARSVISKCRKMTDKPMSVKLSPNVTDITLIAKSVEEAGADALSLINSVQGMAIDAKTRKPKISRIIGGMAGPALKPIALKCVYQCHLATCLPIIGMGGIMTGIDAIEFILAGASAVGVGYANFIDSFSTVRIIREIEDYCIENGISSVSELIGKLIV